MIDHISLTASDLAASKAFYDAALKPLGIEVLWPSDPEAIAFGYGEPGSGKPYFWLAEGRPVTNRLHVAFTAQTRAQVDAFTPPPWLAAAATTAHPACGWSIIRDIMGPMSSIRTG
jgi:catechol 2,3-dioxygenase-like lactoylglutathione lyase family enzyme